jgi:hypothetical protein
MGLYYAIIESKEPVSVATLAARTGSAPELLGMGENIS